MTARWWASQGPLPWNILLVVVVVVAVAVVAVASRVAKVVAATPPHKYVHASEDAGKVTVSEVSSEQLRGRRHAATAPAVRSVDIQPAEMRAVRTPTLPTPMPTTPTPTIPTIPTASATPTTPTVPTGNKPTELDAPRASRGLTSGGLTTGGPTSGGLTSGPLRLRWRASGYVLLAAALLALCGPSAASAAEATAGYVVLVGLPVLDRVLPLRNLAQELLQRGYHVGFALPEHCRHWVADIDQLEFISLGNLLLPSRADDPASGPGDVAVAEDDDVDAAGVYDRYAATLQRYASLQRPMYSALLEDFDEDRPALVVLDRYAFAGFDACQKLAIPFVVHAPSLLIDADAPPAYVPAPFSTFTMLTPSVLARCKNSLDRLRFRLAMVRVFREINAARSDHGLAPVHSKHDLFGRSLVLVSSVVGLDEPRPIAPQFQLIGMLERPRGPNAQKQLSSDFDAWLARDSVKPLVFVSFHGDTPLTPELVTTLLNGLEHIGARLVWKIALVEQAAFDLGARPRDSVYFVRDDDHTMDETLLLERTPVSLLITAGSHYSVLQALALGVPVLGVPFTAEQWETMNMVARTGAGVKLPRASLSDESVRDAAMALLYKPRYAAAAFRLGEIVKTGGGTKRAADHVESVLEFGAAHALPARNSQPLYKTYLVDVYAVYGLILFCSAIVLRSCFAALYHILQLAPDVHLGVTLDDEDEGDVSNGDGGHHHTHHTHHDVHKPATQGHGHHHHDHAHHHNHQHATTHGKEKHL